MSGQIEALECQRSHSIDIIHIGPTRALWDSIKIGAFEKTGKSHLKYRMSKITSLRSPIDRRIEQIAEKSTRSTSRVLQTVAHKRASAISQPEGAMRYHQGHRGNGLESRAKSNR